MNLVSPSAVHPPERPRDDDGRTDEFAALYEAHRQRLFVYCLARTRNPAQAEDVVQDVFAKAFRQLDAFDRSRPFWPWLAAIAARTCVDLHRRQVFAEGRVGDLAAEVPDEHPDPTATTVLHRLDSHDLQRAIDALPSRQRVALQLFAMDGWSYPEIAEQLGCTVATIKQLIVRARAALRSAAARSLAGLGTALDALRARLGHLADKLPGLHALVPDAASGWTQATVGVAALSVLLGGIGAVVVAPPARSTPPAAAPDNRVRRDDQALALAGDVRSEAPTATRPSGPRPHPGEPLLRPELHAVERQAGDAAATAVPPSEAEQGSDTTTFVVSPRYEEDHTVFAVDYYSGLRVSRDGGASWRRPAARGLGTGARLALPPAYPHDNRLFAVSALGGVQVSHNDGQSFELLAALPAVTFDHIDDVMISPAFADDRPALLFVANRQVFEYRHDTGAVRMLRWGQAGLGTTWVTSARYAASYLDDGTILVATIAPFGVPRKPPTVHRCQVVEALLGPELACSESVVLPANSVHDIDLRASGDATPTLLAVAGTGVYRSTDDGRTFQHTTRPRGDRVGHSGLVLDIAVAPGADGGTAVVTQSNVGDGSLTPLELTRDGGRTWTPIAVGLPGVAQIFHAGATVTPTGRILLGDTRGTIFCSVDLGRTWARHCRTPEA